MTKPNNFKHNKVKFDEPELEAVWQKAMASVKKHKTKFKY